MPDPNTSLLIMIIVIIAALVFFVGLVFGALFLGHLFHPDEAARNALSDLEERHAQLLQNYHVISAQLDFYYELAMGLPRAPGDPYEQRISEPARDPGVILTGPGAPPRKT